jgi:hypothetical protein
VTLRVFNSAGEEVALPAVDVPAWHPVTGLRPLRPTFDPATGGVGWLTVDGAGLQLAWDGRNRQGARVASGLYTVQLTLTDSFGTLSSYSAPLQVLESAGGSELVIYNSAGEAVRHFRGLNAAAGARLELDAGGFLPAALGGKDLGIDLGGTTLHWDGRNDQGRLVVSGSYKLRLRSSVERGELELVKDVILLTAPGPDPFAGAWIAPNPAGPADAWMRVKLPSPGNAAFSGRVYNLAGEAVAVLEHDSNGWAWSLKHATSGIYLLVLEASDAEGRRWQRKFKAAVLR